MLHVQRTRLIDARADEVWAVLSRFMQLEEIAPEVVSVEPLSDITQGVGAKRRCTFKNGGTMDEEVIAWEPGRRMRVEMTDTDPMPVTQAQAEIRLLPGESGKTEAIWGIDVRMKYGPVGWLMGQTMLKMMMGKVIDGNLDGLTRQVAAERRATV